MKSIYSRKSELVEAVRFNGENGEEIKKWAGRTIVMYPHSTDGSGEPRGYCLRLSAEGDMAYPGDWIIKDKYAELSSMSDAVFLKRYEPGLSGAVSVIVDSLMEGKEKGSYYHGWQSNIAKAFLDEYSERHGEYGKEDIRIVANEAAKRFLDTFIAIHRPIDTPPPQPDMPTL